MELSHKQTIGRILDDGVALYRGQWRKTYLWSLLICVLAMALPVLKNFGPDLRILSFGLCILMVALLVWFYLCLFYQIESGIRQKPLSNYEILHHAAVRLPSTLLAMLFYVIAISLSLAPLLLLFINQNPFFIALVSMLVVGLCFWTSLALGFFPVAIVSHNLGPIAALTQSWLLMRKVRDWVNATVVISIGTVMFFVLRVLPVLIVILLFGLIQKILGQSFEMQMLQDPFVNFTWGYAGILLLSQAALTALFQPLATAIYLNMYHVLEN